MEGRVEYVGQKVGATVAHRTTSNGCLEPAARMSQTEEQISELDRVQGRLSECIGRLEERLAKGMRGDYPNVDCCENAKEEELVPLADSIRSIRKRISWACDRVDSILNRIEL